MVIDETWIDRYLSGAFNPPNDREWLSADSKRKAIMRLLDRPRKQRAPGIMLRLTVSAWNGGAVLPSHFAPRKKTATADYYMGLLGSDVLRKIEAQMRGELFHFQLDMASAHTAEKTMEFPERAHFSLILRLTAGADLSPLDIYVNSAIKGAIRGNDIRSIGKLQREAAIATDGIRESAEFRATVARAGRSKKGPDG